MTESITAGVQSRCQRYPRCGSGPETCTVDRLQLANATTAVQNNFDAFKFELDPERPIECAILDRFAHVLRRDVE